MDTPLTSLSHGPLHWENSLPPGFSGTGFPGAQPFSATGPFGSVCIQEYKSDKWHCRLSIFRLVEKFVARLHIGQAGLFIAHQLKGKRLIKAKQGSVLTGKNQVVMIQSDQQDLEIEFNPPLHLSFDSFISDEYSLDTLQLFPPLEKKMLVEAGWLSPLFWADLESRDIIQNILRCPHPANIRHYVYDTKMKELLLKYLLLAQHRKQEIIMPKEQEREAIEKIQEVILQDLKQHYSVVQLARLAAMNESRFKQLFKLLMGMGPYEFLLEHRMKKAKQLLQQGRSVKEVAATFGYRPSNFTNLFHAYFGYPPGEVKQ